VLVSWLEKSLRLVLTFALLAGGCTAGSSAPAEHPRQSAGRSKRAAVPAKSADATAKCSPSKRRGTYQVELRPFSSSCPALPDYTERWEGKAPPLGERCSSDVPDRWSDDRCTLERAFTCQQDGGGTSRTAMTSTQKADDASILAGMLSLRRYDKDGSPTCQGTYSFTSTRE
jgi:hypothetical protein